jgi:hypothetical protein
MTSDYIDYLQSEAWQKKRMQRLAIAKFRCAACGSNDRMQVHHLTYARIFNEDMADLLPLCHLHHKAAEEMVSKGYLTRNGDVLFLAAETLRLIIPHERLNKSNSPRAARNIETRNGYQDSLMDQQWFLSALREKRKKFKRICRDRFYGQGHFCKLMANAFALYQRCKH